ncbi:putative metalloprotease CJM1_0395 family protein [Candidatus Magnetominusculus dajiuhuensis]|uniref:putative metalloprotease CJM1_0395 family protein n=1 Tax=Candidatus Magnetominusculus dajiuhuensis TaxID=3137712 RepID=UPI003B43A3F4
MAISPVGYQANSYPATNTTAGGGPQNGNASGSGAAAPSASGDANDTQTQQEIQKLKQRQQHVITHEMAHESVGGQYASAPTYTYTKGPDGKSYINGGEVSIDVSKAKTPEETVIKMRQVRASALAPSDPSPQDESVAQKASQIEAQAQQQIAQQQTGSNATANSTGTHSNVTPSRTKTASPSDNTVKFQQLQSIYSANMETVGHISIYA